MIRFFLFLLVALPLAAQSKQARGKKIVDDALAALGGARFLAMHDREEEGRVYSFYRETLQGLSIARIYTHYVMKPDPPPADFIGVYERQSFGKKKEDNAILFNESGGYRVSYRGASPLPADRVERFRESTMRNVFYILRQRLNEKGLIFDFQSTEVFQNLPVDIVNITDSQNRVTTVYFHHSSKLPVRQAFYHRNAITKEKDEEVTIYAKYRDAGGGVKWPFNIMRERNGEKVYEIFSESVKINVAPKPELFTLPTDVKMLK
jgi:hypothetical protein